MAITVSAHSRARACTSGRGARPLRMMKVKMRSSQNSPCFAPKAHSPATSATPSAQASGPMSSASSAPASAPRASVPSRYTAGRMPVRNAVRDKARARMGPTPCAMPA